MYSVCAVLAVGHFAFVSLSFDLADFVAIQDHWFFNRNYLQIHRRAFYVALPDFRNKII